MSEQAESGLSWRDIAASAYRAYAASTGNKNFRGDPMPAFDDLPVPIKTAWEAAVRHTGNILYSRERVQPERLAEMEQKWTLWVPPQYQESPSI